MEASREYQDKLYKLWLLWIYGVVVQDSALKCTEYTDGLSIVLEPRLSQAL